MKISHAPFNDQAESYDSRAGFSPDISCAIAHKILAIAQVQPNDLIVEIGAGTGIIGQWLIQSSCQYLGLDISDQMLDLFRKKLYSEGQDWQLKQADANQILPVADSSTKVIFSSRTIHLLELEHIVNESFRIAHRKGAVFLMGKIQRQADSVRETMRKKMRNILQEHGLSQRQKEKKHSQLQDLFRERNSTKIDSIEVSSWQVSNTPQQSIDSWQQKQGLAGVNPPKAVKESVLSELATWAKTKFSSLETSIESKEAYIIEGFFIPPKQ
ncbi:MAG: class I SAM-dependent methyltransferase [Trichodesmium sp. MAG_R03]|nr:class I SAM-dependent methyltransferase [Trichodesmium sp. MAG_R03]